MRHISVFLRRGILVALGRVSLAAFAVGDALPEELRDAYENGAEAKLVYRVVDGEGAPVADATAHVWFRSYGRDQDNADWSVRTDTNGVFVASHRLNEKFFCTVAKDGFYRARDERSYFDTEANSVKDGKWQPYGERRILVLYRVRKLGTLRVPERDGNVRWKVPKHGEWLPFDLELFDWCSPNGKGVHEDVLLRFGYFRESHADLRYSMEVSFTNNPCAGAYCLRRNKTSELEGAHKADLGEQYKSTYCFFRERHPGVGAKRNLLDDGSCVVFRTRTKVGETGELVSAHYGIVMGPWSPEGNSDGLEMEMTDGAFNAHANDTVIDDGCFLRVRCLSKTPLANSRFTDSGGFHEANARERNNEADLR